ncbi:MAG: hypothetical protein LBT93_07580 [Treponema sp.]|jgi:hypothetical protein|nr:hypothetical protein [Treponema sp.]
MVKQKADEPLFFTVIRILSYPSLRRPVLLCVKSIFYCFFFLQYKAALFPNRIPVSGVDHPLDKKIPFAPRWVKAYLDFVAFWIRLVGFLLRRYRRRGIGPAEDFITSIGKLYDFAAEVYTKNLSTTHRPRYLAHPRFLLIHAADPHLMCIPSLHVMIVIRAYTQFRAILRALGEEGACAEKIAEVKRGAQTITEAILFVKQHSINCIAAAMYAMSRFDGELFPPIEAEDFISGLFLSLPVPSPADRKIIGDYIMELYRRFLREGEGAPSWEEPLIAFLRTLPARQKNHSPGLKKMQIKSPGTRI